MVLGTPYRFVIDSNHESKNYIPTPGHHRIRVSRTRLAYAVCERTCEKFVTKGGSNMSYVHNPDKLVKEQYEVADI
ncbi:hypothetical protein VNO77_09629 [Canavalia gladiata]|uniref:Uncharacterized protein n=1 Tax=Canavalia gladiata TaxID=3824 RepID=A0AAN9M9D5_CANGL